MDACMPASACWSRIPGAAAAFRLRLGGPKLYQVRGKVTLKDGTPVKYGHVILHADAAKGNATQGGVPGNDPKRRLHDHDRRREGASPGHTG